MSLSFFQNTLNENLKAFYLRNCQGLQTRSITAFRISFLRFFSLFCNNVRKRQMPFQKKSFTKTLIRPPLFSRKVHSIMSYVHKSDFCLRRAFKSKLTARNSLFLHSFLGARWRFSFFPLWHVYSDALFAKAAFDLCVPVIYVKIILIRKCSLDSSQLCTK